MRRKIEPPGMGNYWPAFTDVLSGLLVMLILLLILFMISEVLMSREMLKRGQSIDQLSSVTTLLEDLIGQGETKTQRMERELLRLDSEVRQRGSLLDEARAQLAAARSAREELQQSLGQREQALHEQRQLADRLDHERGQWEKRVTEQHTQLARLESQHARSQNELTFAEEQQALLSTRLERLGAEYERLNQVLAIRDKELAQNQGQLRDRDQQVNQMQTQLSDQNEHIQVLDARIKRHLIARVEQLESYASDFFGRLRKVFADNPDIKIVGDRFVFQSEVLFASAQAELVEAGESGLDQFVQVYRQLETAIPKDLPVLIEVQGHTDNVPIRNNLYPSNWELSHARAQSVVSYLIQRGVPPQRLAATGMGEFHPIAPQDQEEGRKRNRRIEIKITSR